MLTNKKQFNGEFGCDYCKHSGKNVRKERKDGTLGGEKRVFCLELPLPVRRTHEETLQETKEAVSEQLLYYYFTLYSYLNCTIISRFLMIVFLLVDLKELPFQ